MLVVFQFRCASARTGFLNQNADIISAGGLPATRNKHLLENDYIRTEF